MSTSNNSISLSKQTFTKQILEKLQNRLGEEYTLLVESVTKNNGVILTGLIAKRRGATAYPTIYIDGLYKEAMSEREMQSVIEKLYQEIGKAETDNKIDLSGFIDFSTAKEHLAFKLIHAEKNKEYLQHVPHRRFHNLAVVFYYTVQEHPFYGNGMIVIRDEHMKQWKVSTEELYQAAMNNMPILFPAVIQNIEEVMKGLLKTGIREEVLHIRENENAAEIFSDDWINELLTQMTDHFQTVNDRIPMYVLTNRQKLQGAAVILYPGVLKKFAEEIKQDFYVLPSSIHEVILVPAKSVEDAGMLRDIVSDINRTQVAPDEILADSVYFYSQKRDLLEWIC